MLSETTFADYQAQSANASFSDWLVLSAGASWLNAINHPFTQAVGDDTISDADYARYLLEDYSFIKDLASSLGYLVAKAPTMEAKGVLAAFLAQLTSSENDYFIRSFAALGIDEQTYQGAGQGEVTRATAATLLSAAGKAKYEDGLACLLCAEWVYREWCTREARKPRPERFYLAEWIELHDNPAFLRFVDWLRAEVDRVGAILPEWRQREVRERFVRMCELEAAFFSAVSPEAQA
ncbi:TenA family protein [Pseudovibrio exalbescens]|uniref:Aminopyrimidine aminohydrolase n=1 Tax=Pseudovibrio exalbescens TaxID=197461 RepID=A0A1U7JGU5_9HYPH|nr:TenA family protein [Pseudovibrio exalbescens]OKL43912.1 transcriptional regulator [Pseudovibrio exalbescens]